MVLPAMALFARNRPCHVPDTAWRANSTLGSRLVRAVTGCHAIETPNPGCSLFDVSGYHLCWHAVLQHASMHMYVCTTRVGKSVY